jgi:hypothetical protein
MRARFAAVLVFGVFLSACGFSPIYKMDGAQNGGMRFAALALPDSDNGRLLARALDGRWQADPQSQFSVTIRIDETARETQLNAEGVAARIELDYVLHAEIYDRQSDKTTPVSLRHAANIERSDSGADDLSQRRNQARLAMQSLGERLLLNLSRRHSRDAATGGGP